MEEQNDGVALNSTAHPADSVIALEMKCEAIARVCHEVNRAYCTALGDHSQPAWDDAPRWQQLSAEDGVAFALGNPNATPAQMHENWLKAKVADGWVYGATKLPSLKQHPCMLPYDELPQEQRIKDHLFRAVVKAMS